jgi:hypothetical protein
VNLQSNRSSDANRLSDRVNLVGNIGVRDSAPMRTFPSQVAGRGSDSVENQQTSSVCLPLPLPERFTVPQGPSDKRNVSDRTPAHGRESGIQ